MPDLTGPPDSPAALWSRMASAWKSRNRVDDERTLAEFARRQLSGSRFAHFFILACGGMLVGVLHALADWGWLPASGLSDTLVGAGIAALLVMAYVSLYGEPFVLRLVGISLYMPALGLLLAAGTVDPASHAERLSLFLFFPLVSATLTIQGIGVVGIAVASGLFLAYHAHSHVHVTSIVLWLQWVLAIVFGAVLRHFRLRLAMHSHLRRVELQSRVRTDPLTGLNNRLGWNELAPALLEDARSRGLVLCVLFFDVDRFKLVNDVYGHDAGDEVLQRLGRLIQRLRPPRSVVARLGGEEFVAITAGPTADAARQFAENVRSQFADLERPRDITVSIGVACVASGEKLSETMKRSDRALYRAKDGGRNRVEID